MTLKIGSRSPKSNQLIPPSQQCICASLVKISQLVQKITQGNEATRTQTGSAPKTICPPPFGWGDIITGMEEDLQQFSETFTSEFSVDTPINSLWTSFKSKSLSSINKHVPSKMTSRYCQSWCNRTVRRLSRRKHRAFRKARQNSNKMNWTRYKNIQKTCKEECKKAYNDYVCDMVSDESSCKKLYSFVKDKKCESSGVAPRKKDGITHYDASTKSEILNGQFLSAFTMEDASTFPDLGTSNFPNAPEIKVHPNRVRKLLKNLKPHKATGPDDISPRFLKEMAETLTPILTLIFSASLKQGTALMTGKRLTFLQSSQREIKVNRPITDLYH